MNVKTTWVITGATSMIAREFAHLAAQQGHPTLLIGRDSKQLELIATDLFLRYNTPCEWVATDLSQDTRSLTQTLQSRQDSLNFFLAHAVMVNNEALDYDNIHQVINTNVSSTVQLIHSYLKKPQNQHRLIYLSSVAACRGRAKNSLYGASKAGIDVYLGGLQQAAGKNQFITSMRLGFIDTKLTYGEPGIFYAAAPKACAKACWNASTAGKAQAYYPFFWQFIGTLIAQLPNFLFKRMKSV